MLSQNTDFDLSRLVLMLLVNALEAERRQRNINEQILQRLDKLEALYIKHEVQLEEHHDLFNIFEAEIPHIRHIVCRNEELENSLAFYCPPD